MSNLKRLEDLGKVIKDAELLKVRAIERRNSLVPQYNKVAGELKSMGINLNDIDADIQRKENKIQELLDSAYAIIPEDIINKYKNIDFNSTEEEEPNFDNIF